LIQLTTNLSGALIELIRADQAPIDAIEVGTWFSVKQIRRYQRHLPGWEFHFHAGTMIVKVGVVPGTIRRLKAYLLCTSSPWASLHLSLLPPVHLWLALRFGWYLPSPDLDWATRRSVRRVAKLAAAIDAPVILENMPSLEAGRYTFEGEPDRITAILEITNCDLLLDIAHAQVAAGALGMDMYDYLNSLPLERVVQIHVSGPRMRDGYLYDAHESLHESDYALLEWVLARTRPQVLTLEYFREREALREQLWCLRGILDGM
jgi:uncharacterized protein (UPF0276 family)